MKKLTNYFVACCMMYMYVMGFYTACMWNANKEEKAAKAKAEEKDK